jgi:hypothetical protein
LEIGPGRSQDDPGGDGLILASSHCKQYHKKASESSSGAIKLETTAKTEIKFQVRVICSETNFKYRTTVGFYGGQSLTMRPEVPRAAEQSRVDEKNSSHHSSYSAHDIIISADLEPDPTHVIVDLSEVPIPEGQSTATISEHKFHYVTTVGSGRTYGRAPSTMRPQVPRKQETDPTAGLLMKHVTGNKTPAITLHKTGTEKMSDHNKIPESPTGDIMNKIIETLKQGLLEECKGLGNFFRILFTATQQSAETTRAEHNQTRIKVQSPQGQSTIRLALKCRTHKGRAQSDSHRS